MSHELRRISVLFLLLALAVPALGRAAVPASERSALVSLYNGTGGARWTNRTGWLGQAGTECNWFGVVCNATGTTVVEIYLSENGLSGSLPGAVGNLPGLRTLEAAGNALSGALPKDLGKLANLRSLRLGLNQLSGAIPKELGNLANLENLGLAANRLSGAIPPDLSRLARLQVLDLSRNDVSGGIPTQLGQLRALVYLDLSANELTGAIPPALGGIPDLLSLSLESNQLTGSIPRELGNLLLIQQLILADNQLTGRIPAELGNLQELLFFDLSRNQLTGTIPLELGNASGLRGLLLSGNRLGGSIPDALGNIEGLAVLWLDGNRLTGPVPIGLAGLVELTDGGGLDLRGNALATDTEPWLREWLDSKQVGGNWTSSQAPAAPLEVGSSLGSLHDRRPGGFVYWTLQVGAGAPPLTVSTASGGTGNADLFIRFGAPPTLAQNDGSSRSPGNQEEVTVASPKPGTYYIGLYAQSPYRGVTLKPGGSSAACFPGGSTLCLSGGRFKVQVAWRTRDGRTGAGQAKALTADTGYFWFFNESNVEMVIKVLDACGVNGKFWVFAGGLTDVQTDITVTDTRTDTVRTYRNPQGTAFQPIQDTVAFSTCSAASTAEDLEIETAAAEAWQDLTGIAAKAGACVSGPASLCLANGRFRVEVGWRKPNGEEGAGQAVALTSDTGYFWFFNETNVEIVIKVLDACGVNNKFWVFAGGLTDVRTEIRVTDTVTGVTKTYTNPPGTAFRPIQDTGAFATCQ